LTTAPKRIQALPSEYHGTFSFNTNPNENAPPSNRDVDVLFSMGSHALSWLRTRLGGTEFALSDAASEPFSPVSMHSMGWTNEIPFTQYSD